MANSQTSKQTPPGDVKFERLHPSLTEQECIDIRQWAVMRVSMGAGESLNVVTSHNRINTLIKDAEMLAKYVATGCHPE